MDKIACTTSKILLVEDDESLRELLKDELENNDYVVDDAADLHRAKDLLNNKEYSAIILDLKLPDGNGLELFNTHLTKLQNKTLVITANATISSAVEAIKKGAFNYIEKPFDESILQYQVEKIIEFSEMKSQNKLFKNEIISSYTFEDIIYESKEMKELIYRAKVLAKTDNIILIQGETGVGKEIFSHSIHNDSNRSKEIFLPINCAAIPLELVESELFGFKKGAFTGADESYSGKFIQANNGTLFFDEIGDLSLQIQAKLLRVMDDNMIYLLKSHKPQRINIRLIAATNKDLEKEVDSNNFRKDLFYRLQESTLLIPPLRERKDDIMPIVNYFLNNFNQMYNKNVTRITKKAETYLINHRWEGNVREIKNLLKSIIPFKKDDTIDIKDILFPLKNGGIDKKDAILPLVQHERNYVRNIFNKTGFKKKETAELLDISLPTLYKYLKD
jgi:two-component system NtrC family response regulator